MANSKVVKVVHSLPRRDIQKYTTIIGISSVFAPQPEHPAQVDAGSLRLPLPAAAVRMSHGLCLRRPSATHAAGKPAISFHMYYEVCHMGFAFIALAPLMLQARSVRMFCRQSSIFGCCGIVRCSRCQACRMGFAFVALAPLMLQVRSIRTDHSWPKLSPGCIRWLVSMLASMQCTARGVRPVLGFAAAVLAMLASLCPVS